MRKIYFQIREQEKCISLLNHSKLLDFEQSYMQNDRFFPSNFIEEMKDKHLNFCNDTSGDIDTKDIFNLSFANNSEGIFLLDNSAKNNVFDFSNLIEEYGLWNAQGINNHIHLNDYEHDPIKQIFIANNIIMHWIDCLTRDFIFSNYIIYWNGWYNSTLCIYSGVNVDSSFLAEFDEHLEMSNKKIWTIVK